MDAKEDDEASSNQMTIIFDGQNFGDIPLDITNLIVHSSVDWTWRSSYRFNGFERLVAVTLQNATSSLSDFGFQLYQLFPIVHK
mmetsp:Transcript_9895/g.23417  ORF Transcript_9895/g.23417 Transcript_9895/m.23417 type:complete len:84 (+) Transcript_9895:164-415(+)